MEDIPIIDIKNLYADKPNELLHVDQKIAFAASSVGFFIIKGHKEGRKVGSVARKKMLKVFDIPLKEQRYLWKKILRLKIVIFTEAYSH